MSFKAGDKVRCVTPAGELEAGKIYTVEALTGKRSDSSTNRVSLQGLAADYYVFRFELVEEPTSSGTIVLSGDSSTVSLPPSTPLDITFYKGSPHPEFIGGFIRYSIPKQADKASKNDQDKIDLSLIPYISNIEHARAFMVGERKYGRYNYCKGHKASQLVGAAQRHLHAWFNGEDHDPIDGQHHLGSVMACCSMILRQEELGTLIDDRYTKPSHSEP